jgi:hypothetical protein
MRKDVTGAVASRTSAGRWPIGLSSAAQLLGEVAIGMVAGAPGVLAYRSVVVTAAQQVAATLHNFGRGAS